MSAAWKALGIMIAVLLLLAGATVYYFLYYKHVPPRNMLLLTTTTTTTTSSSSTTTATTTSYSTTINLTTSANLSGNYTATVDSVRVAKLGYDASNGTTIYRSTITISFPLQNSTLARYTFSIEPWNASIINGTTSEVTFSNGVLTELQPDYAGIIMSHTHILLNMIVGGARILVPSGLGISNGTKNQFGQEYNGIMLSIHTHDQSDVVHFESSVANANFTLGDMFGEWGYAFNSSCLWGSCGGTVSVYLNSSSTPFPTPTPETIAVPHNVPANTPYNVTIVWNP
jgi:hypothetical protein